MGFCVQYLSNLHFFLILQSETHIRMNKALFFSETTKSSREAARQQRRRNQNLGKKEDQHQMKTVRNSISISENNVLLHLIEFSH